MNYKLKLFISILILVLIIIMQFWIFDSDNSSNIKDNGSDVINIDNEEVEEEDLIDENDPSPENYFNLLETKWINTDNGVVTHIDFLVYFLVNDYPMLRIYSEGENPEYAIAYFYMFNDEGDKIIFNPDSSEYTETSFKMISDKEIIINDKTYKFDSLIDENEL